MNDDEVFEAYEARFREPLSFPPLDYGHGVVSFEQLVQHGRDALERGSPIVWSKVLTPIPQDSKS